jgi:pyruvate dehydrogenase E2 component (dihydrolipoamide acetyltransferase)
MAEIINMPRLSDTMEEGTVAKWFKKVGDSIKEGDILAEIETDKATMEFESFNDGILLYIGIDEGGTAPVDSLLAIIGKKNENINSLIEERKKSYIETNNKSEINKQVVSKEIKSIPKDVEIITMPRLSDTMEEGTVVAWFKNIGDIVKEGDILAEIETDKATMEFESFYSGTLLYIGLKKGESAPVESILAIIGDPRTNISEILESYNNSKSNIENKEVFYDKDIKEEENTIEESDDFLIEKHTDVRIFASPLAKKIASEKGFDIKLINGSGDNGRIIKRDVDSYDPRVNSLKSSLVIDSVEASKVFPNSQMRKVIAKRLSESKFSAPHYYLGVEFDMDNVIAFRNQFNSLPDTKISFNDIILKACALCLKKHPEVNSSWNENQISHHSHVHIGVAVSVEEGLVVPVIKFANEKTLSQIGLLVKEYASRAKNKKLKPEEMQGSTFTVSNLGMFDIQEFTSIINLPNSAILSVGSIVQKPVVKFEKIVVGNIMKLTLACDHRSVDGVTGSKFLQTLREYIENPITLLV